MSELKVNTITGLGGQITITDPVAIGGSAQSGYELTVAGKTKTSQSIDVVTVAAEDFGIRIRAPFSSGTNPGFGDSTIQFTSNNGNTEYASIHAKNTNSLVIKTNGADRVTIDSFGTVTHTDKTVLVGDTTANGNITANGSIQVNGVATFSPFVPYCPTQCTANNQLANKAYVDQQIQLYATPKYFWLPQKGVSVGVWHNLSVYGVPDGAYAVRLFSRLYTGQGPVQTHVWTRTMAGAAISSSRNLNWVAALGSSDNAGAQAAGDFPLARTIGRVNEDTQVYVDSANYGCFIDGYWK